MRKVLSTLAFVLALTLSLVALFSCNGGGDDSNGSGSVAVSFVVDGGVYTKAWSDSEGKVKFPNTTTNYLFYAEGSAFSTASFTDSKNPYQMPTKITVLNQSAVMKLCNKANTIKAKVDSGALRITDTQGKLTIV